MKFLEDAGHNLTLYYYSAPKFPKFTLDGIRRTLDDASAFPKLKAEMRMYSPEVGIEGDFHAVVASDWATAYAAYRHAGTAKRFYFVQDFEPVFFPAGSDFVVAENSYRLGFHGLTVGPWLSEKLTREYGMKADHYDYAVDSKFYTRTNDSRRDDVIFYARPTTPRRATEFGLLVLEEFHRLRPEVTIHLAGWDMSDYKVPFAYVNHGAMDVRELPPLYNQCAAALSISLTSSSLFPFEVMACGVQPVVNDADNTRVALGNNKHIDFVPLSPQAMARALIAAIDRPDQVEHSRKISSSFGDAGWSDAGTQFVDAFMRVMTGGK
jgi:glycosyltransferase involved in cell wall biosynthesis